ncbi:MAG: GNAT family N-acetyltransferase [Elusimicrobiota bacterium]|nr:MAG: GNAT family N-acetyltransferase [Elusimicrobiota bacterium]
MSNDDLSWETPSDPNPADLAVVDGGLGTFNSEAADTTAIKKLACFVRSGAGHVLGGAVGRTWGEAVELQQLWVTKDLRGKGLGAKLVALFEAEARRRGCRLVYLDTFTFQAPEFYAKLGYETACRFDGFPGGVSKLVMRKPLA